MAICHENVKEVQWAWQEEFHKKNWPDKRTIKMVSQFSSFHNASFCLPMHFCHQKCFSSLFFRLYDKFKCTGSVQDDKKAMTTTTASVAPDEAKERVDDFLLLITYLCA
ncbi:hypothetical protein AVEN_54161-1 [Araneus ventricosus]|uniref:DUF4817 domain-containing protein n=1 Tax=Araneus ventricosus TaxID=182803 RepID=A0A4Y2BVS1_ARAVE|nr:hypothetical protein AVEN_54161-1 [Araneus ventricosus]